MKKKLSFIALGLGGIFILFFCGLFVYYTHLFKITPAPDNAPEMHIAFSTNDAYAHPLGVALTSLLWHNRDTKVHLYVMNETLSQAKKDELTKIVAYFPNADLTFLSVYIPDEFARYFTYLVYLSKDTFSRILLPELLPHLDKILYMDADIVFNGNLLPFYQTDVQGNALAGAKDGQEERQKKHFAKYHLSRYICAGTLLLNLDYMRTHAVSKRLFDFLYANLDNPLIKWPDQDAINIELNNEILQVDDIWLSDARMTRGFDTVVMHYAGNPKPWKEDHFQGFYWNAYNNMRHRILTQKNPHRGMVWDYTWMKITQAVFIPATFFAEAVQAPLINYIAKPFLYPILDWFRQ